MPSYKTTFFFEGFQQSSGLASGSAVGWTETWYRTLDGGIDNALNDQPVNTYAAMRRRFLPSLYRLAWIRASEDGNPRNTKVRSLASNFGIAAGDPAQVTCAVLVDFTALPVNATDHAHHRRMLVRGLPISMIDGNILRGGGPDYQAFLDFLNYLVTGTVPVAIGPFSGPPVWQIRFQRADVPFTPIVALTIDLLGPNFVHIDAGIPIPPFGTRVIVKGVTFPYNVNRQWTSFGESVFLTGGFRLGRSRKTLSGIWKQTGVVAVFTPGFAPPAQYLIIGLRERKTGRPFRLTRGRRNPVV